MSLGPVMLDLEGTALSADEEELLRHPAVGGVILFSWRLSRFSGPAKAVMHAIRSATGAEWGCLRF